ncbi:hypothetical protein DFH09DRAFT_1150186 [Mycena vulgaris]|nr:hypothetical protein DFH09DRAFT_1150186 [Mycena vulgaris]
MLESSRTISQDGPGHCSTAIATLCTQKLIRDYYAGIMPENGTTCATEYDFFPGQGKSAENVRLLNEADSRLVESARVVGDLLQDIRLS